MSKTSRGFTLIELLVVIAIIAILAAILFPVFARVQERARQSACQNNMKQLATAMQSYVDDNNGAFPDQSAVGFAYTKGPVDATTGGDWIKQFSHRYRTDAADAPAGLAKVLWRHLKNLGVYKCPSEVKKRPPTAPAWLPYEVGSSYYYKHVLCWIANVQGAPTRQSDATYPTKITLLYEEAWHGSRPPWLWNGEPNAREPFKMTSAIFMDCHVGRLEVPRFEVYGYDGNWFFYTGASKDKMDVAHNRELRNGGRDIF